MKKYIYLLSAVALFSACSSLDQEPSTSVSTTTAITTVQDLANAINGAYYLACYGDQMSMASEMAIYADELGPDSNVDKGSGQYAQKIQERSVTDNDSYGIYYYLYKAIANINQALAAAEEIDADEDEIAPYVAELHGMRGLFHFHLATFFAPIPTSGSTNDLGIVLSTDVYDLDYKGARATLDQTYQQIVDDLTACIDSKQNKAKNDGHVNYWAALALRARAYLYWGKYNLALADADSVIQHSPYKLYTRDNYVASWKTQDGTDEMIMQYIQDDNYNAQRYNPGYYTHPDGYTEYLVTTAFYNFMKADLNDIRSEMVAWKTTENGNGVDGYYPLKYPGKTGSSVPLYANNIKVVRLSEMYLIAAEAALKAGDPVATAAGYLNTLRQNRITGYVNVATTDIDDIINERRKELFAEGQIAFDYWRNGKTITSGVRTFGPDDYQNVLPIPKEELNACGDILVQNPGY